MAVVGLSFYHARYISVPTYSVTGTFRFTWMLGYIALIWIATYAIGLPDQPRNVAQAAWVASVSTGIGAGGISAIQLVVGDKLLPRFVVLGAALVNVPIQVLANWFSRRARTRAQDRDKVLLVANAEVLERLVEDLQMEPERSASLVASISPTEVLEVRPGFEPLVELQKTSGATVLVLDHDAQVLSTVIGQAAKLHEAGVRIRTLQGFYEEWVGKLPLDELERASLFFDIGELHGRDYDRTTRMIDIAVAVVGTLLLMLLVPFVLLGNLIGNRGPLIYKQVRVGKGGEEFTIFKFRTMVAASPDKRTKDTENGSVLSHGEWTAENDPRITPFGRILRKTHLDELPQMINIIRGDLSIVGPRPEQPHYVEELRKKLAFYDLRHLVRPGLTGWAQVKYGYASDEKDALEKLQYEFFYLRRQDLAFDLRIMLRTIRSLVGGQGSGR